MAKQLHHQPGHEDTFAHSLPDIANFVCENEKHLALRSLHSHSSESSIQYVENYQ